LGTRKSMNMNFYDDTIAAPATIPGTGAISIIRLSGPSAFAIADKVVKLHSGSVAEAKANTIHFGTIFQSPSEPLDDVLVSVFKAPHSYTGEDSVEISCHASSYIVQTALSLLLNAGARMAMPGEFTRRAFTSGKMDLAQAESVADLIAASSESAHRAAFNQLRGGFSSELKELRAELLEATSLMELELDFSEEDVEFADRDKLSGLIAEAFAKVSSLADSFRLGNAIRNGVPTAIAGPANAGKSTLLNALLGEDRAIVSDIPGTTRDTVEETVNLDGVLFRFIDTAGIRESSDTIEKAGIERSFRKVREADIVLAIADICKSPLADLSMIISHVDPSHQKLFILLNKSDILSAGSPAPVSDVLSAGSPAPVSDVLSAGSPAALAKDIEAKTGFKTLAISALNPADIKAVKALLSSEMKDRIGEGGQTLVTNLRHYKALKEAQEALGRVREGLDAGRTTDLVAQDLRDAISALGEITGMDISEDEILGNIFSHFCIGK
jgi:tRNA modification GTPase